MLNCTEVTFQVSNFEFMNKVYLLNVNLVDKEFNLMFVLLLLWNLYKRRDFYHEYRGFQAAFVFEDFSLLFELLYYPWIEIDPVKALFQALYSRSNINYKLIRLLVTYYKISTFPIGFIDGFGKVIWMVTYNLLKCFKLEVEVYCRINQVNLA